MRSRPANPTHPEATANDYRPNKADRVTLVVLLAIVLLAAVERTSTYIYRLAELHATGSHTVPVKTYGLHATAELHDTTSGTPFPIDVSAGSVTVDRLTSIETGYLTAQHTVAYIATLAVVTALILLGRNTFRGRVFSRANTAILFVGATLGAAGYFFSSLLQQMASNELIHRLSEGNLEVWMLASGNPTPVLLGTLAFTVVLFAYAVGARLQRETEGLV
ncbi:hypothetical protein FB468_1489 [Leucobacter komagatae]|uniref:DUF2975 family protein n=1 Tax=Leucobacter komagatae TaxID=55969 RepID=A0A542Y5V8_9MICO|nr:hypothetical protein [Leucobacter komagatae]TQL43468.1 hypothetical protein FB468_1489 [Leucobacter komagatae]